ncbi:PAP2 superfamily protein [compost metagenome]
MPSMHCAYPLLGLLTAWKATTWKTRWIHVAYTALMFSAAVYLDHHWILDAIAGWILAIVAVLVAKRLLPKETAT